MGTVIVKKMWTWTWQLLPRKKKQKESSKSFVGLYSWFSGDHLVSNYEHFLLLLQLKEILIMVVLVMMVMVVLVMVVFCLVCGDQVQPSQSRADLHLVAVFDIS